MNVIDGNNPDTFRSDVHRHHDWIVPRTEKLYVRATSSATKLRRIRFKRPSFCPSVGGDANRPDGINVIANTKLEAG
jgi:hypothetical protein